MATAESLPEVIFVNLGIEINKLNEVAFRVFGLEIYWYSLFIYVKTFTLN